MSELKRMSGETLNLTKENIDKLKELFPEVLTEDQVDFEKLRLILGDEINDKTEKYSFTWNGKNNAIKLAQQPSTGTLRPNKEKSKNWDATENLYIEGDNLEVLKLLQKSYAGKVDVIYIDPPYNTGNDFVYQDDFQNNIENYLKLTNQLDEAGNKFTTNVESSGRFHTDWLNMMLPRLILAKNLLSDSGIIFISIDDNELFQLKLLCDQVFGENNFINNIIVQMSNMSGPKVNHAINGLRYPKLKESLLVYVKNRKDYKLEIPKYKKDTWDREYNLIIPDFEKDTFDSLLNMDISKANKIIKNMDLQSLNDYMISNDIKRNDIDWLNDNAYRIFASKPNTSLLNNNKNIDFKQSIYLVKNNSGDSKLIKTDFNRGTKTARIELVSAERNNSIYYGDIWTDISTVGGVGQEGGVEFKNGKKPLQLIKRIIESHPNENALVLDFFSGSGTTGQAVMELNQVDQGDRSFILVQLPEIILEGSSSHYGEFQTITELAQKRLLNATSNLTNTSNGFKVFGLDNSNIKKWNMESDNIEESLFTMENNFVEGRSHADIVYEVLLKLGLDLNTPFEESKVEGSTLYDIAFGNVYVVLGDNITQEVASYIAKKQKEYENENPSVVFNDNGFKNDNEKLNSIEILKNNGFNEEQLMSI